MYLFSILFLCVYILGKYMLFYKYVFLFYKLCYRSHFNLIIILHSSVCANYLNYIYIQPIAYCSLLVFHGLHPTCFYVQSPVMALQTASSSLCCDTQCCSNHSFCICWQFLFDINSGLLVLRYLCNLTEYCQIAFQNRCMFSITIALFECFHIPMLSLIIYAIQHFNFC